MRYETLLLETTDGIGLLTINRPDKMNALNSQVFNDLEKAMDDVSADPSIRSLIITGAGAKAFVAGADISEFAALSKTEAMALSKKGQDIFFKIERSGKPVIAAVNGFALGGGCELAMACHFRLCSEQAKFGQPEVNLGLIPGYGGTQRLTQLVGKGRSMELQMSGRMIDAEEALRIGLVNYVTAPEQLIAQCTALLQLINAKAPVAISKLIGCINTAVVNDDDTNGYDKEVESFGECFDTADMKEGTSAFLEKRKAIFTGK